MSPSHREVGTCWCTLVRSVCLSLCCQSSMWWVCLPCISLQRFVSCRRSNTRRWPNAGLMLAHRLRHWPTISSVLGGMWASVTDGGPTLTQLWFKAWWPYRQYAGTPGLDKHCTHVIQMFSVYWVERTPANTRRWTSGGLMLGQRHRRWASIGPAFGQRRVCWECWQVFCTKTEQ